MLRSFRRIICATLLLCLSLWSGASAQSSSSSYTNPVMAGDYPDPSVIRVGSDYWAMATTGGWAPHFSIMHSRDLVNWRVVGSVFQAKPAWAKGDFWAPELIADGGRYFVFYTARRDDGAGKRGTLCVAVATASAPSGPYTDHGPLTCQISELKNVGSIDAFFVRDENKEPYLIWKADGNDANPQQPTVIFAQRLSEDGTKLLGKRREILRNTAAWEKHVTEGSYILRHDGWFYHFYSGNACCGRSCEYALGVARSRKLLGPWEKNPANPILAANDAWQCPGHGDIVTTSDGRDFLLYHAYRHHPDAFHIGREALLDAVTWNENGWPTINDGHGPSGTAAAPVNFEKGSAQAEFFDGFTAPQLDPSWQWPMSGVQGSRIDAAPGGYLVLTPGAQNADKFTGALLAQRAGSGDYVATTLVDTRSLATGTNAGLSAYSWRDDAVGIGIGEGRVFVWRRDGKDQQTSAVTLAPNAPSIYLRMTVTGGEQFRFAFSANGRDWKEIGDVVQAGNVEGAHIALTAGGAAGSGAKFDWIKITPARLK